MTGHIIKKRLKELGWTQLRLAETVGVRPSNVSGWVSGAYDPREDVLPKVAQALNLTEAELKGEPPFREHGGASLTGPAAGASYTLDSAHLRQQLLEAKEREFELRQTVWDLYQDWKEFTQFQELAFPPALDWAEIDRGSDEYSLSMQQARDELQRRYDDLEQRFTEASRREPRQFRDVTRKIYAAKGYDPDTGLPLRPRLASVPATRAAATGEPADGKQGKAAQRAAEQELKRYEGEGSPDDGDSTGANLE